jgi:hypothetical protein
LRNFLPNVLKELIPIAEKKAKEYYKNRIEENEMIKKDRELLQNMPPEVKISEPVKKLKVESPKEYTVKAKTKWAITTVKLSFKSEKNENPYIKNLDSSLASSDGARAALTKVLIDYLIQVADKYIPMKEEFLQSKNGIEIMSTIRRVFSTYPDITLAKKESISEFNKLLGKVTLFGIDSKLDFTRKEPKDENVKKQIKEWAISTKPNIIRLIISYVFHVLEQLPYSDGYKRVIEIMIEKFNKLEGINVLPGFDNPIWGIVQPKMESIIYQFNQDTDNIIASTIKQSYQDAKEQIDLKLEEVKNETSETVKDEPKDTQNSEELKDIIKNELNKVAKVKEIKDEDFKENINEISKDLENEEVDIETIEEPVKVELPKKIEPPKKKRITPLLIKAP